MRLAALLALGVSGLAHAQDKPVQPYIDQLRREMEEDSPGSSRDAGRESYTESIKKRLKSGEDESFSGYTERLKRELGPAPTERSYSESEKRRLGKKDTGGAIAAVKEGRSELQMKREGRIRHAFGLRYNVAPTRVISAPGRELRSFDDVYGGSYAPELGLFYEYQPFRSEVLGNLGFVFNLGASVHKGQGVFGRTLYNAGACTPPYSASTCPDGAFSDRSRTNLTFITVPVMVGAAYRFHLLKYVRPFVMAGPTGIFYFETRDDAEEGSNGVSRGLQLGGGASFLLDWISPRNAWDLYAEEGIKHYYLTVEYQRITTIGGDVDFSVSGIYAGLTFEF